MKKLSSRIHAWSIELLSDVSLEAQDAALATLNTLGQLLEREVDVRHILANAAVPVAERAALVSRLVPSATPAILDVLRRILQEGALKDLSALIHHATQIRERFGVASEVEVMSAIPLLPKEREALQRALEKSWGTHVVLHERVDPSVIGGLRLRSDDWFFDATVRGRTERLAQSLVAI